MSKLLKNKMVGFIIAILLGITIGETTQYIKYGFVTAIICGIITVPLLTWWIVYNDDTTNK